MGYALIMFGVLLLMSVVMVTAVNYGIAKDSQIVPLKAENIYAERESGKAQTDLVITATKINGTAIYTSVDQSPNLLNLYLTIKNNGSIVLDSREYSIIFNNTWVKINSTSKNVTSPLVDSATSSLNLKITPPSEPMRSLSLLVAAVNGVKIITPTSPILNYVDVYNNATDPSCWYDVNMSWQASYGEIWPISNYTVYYMANNSVAARIDKNEYSVAFTQGPSTTQKIGRAFAKQQCGDSTNSSIYLWVSATDTHGNEGPPSNTCTTTGLGGYRCNV